MVSVLAALAVFLIGGLFSAACTVILRRNVAKESLKKHHETLIYYVSILTAMYGLLIGFIILSLWEQQDKSRKNTEEEAIAAQALIMLADVLPEPHKTRIQRAVKDYLESVLEEEWPAMLRGEFAALSRMPKHLQEVWDSWLDLQPQSARETIILDEAIDQLSALNKSRSTRVDDARDRLSPYLWTLLALGAVLIFLSMFFIAMDYLPSQVGLTAVCGGWLLVMLFVVFDLQSPFHGFWVVGTDPYQQTLEWTKALADETRLP